MAEIPRFQYRNVSKIAGSWGSIMEPAGKEDRKRNWRKVCFSQFRGMVPPQSEVDPVTCPLRVRRPNYYIIMPHKWLSIQGVESNYLFQSNLICNILG